MYGRAQLTGPTRLAEPIKGSSGTVNTKTNIWRFEILSKKKAGALKKNICRLEHPLNSFQKLTKCSA
jgi:hypothetical protein